MIQIQNICKSYGSQQVLDDINLTIKPGGIISLIGANGAGKSTLLSIIGRLSHADSGTVSINGHPIASTNANTMAKLVSMQRQENHFVARLSVYDLVSFGRYPYSKGRLTQHDKMIIERALEYLQLTDLAERFIDELSGGQRQRVYVAMVLSQDTPYILLDEPLNNLDMRHGVLMMKLIRNIADELGKTIILVIHDINFASVYSDRLIAMKDGRVIFDDVPSQIMHPTILKNIFDIDVDVHVINNHQIGIYY